MFIKLGQFTIFCSISKLIKLTQGMVLKIKDSHLISFHSQTTWSFTVQSHTSASGVCHKRAPFITISGHTSSPPKWSMMPSSFLSHTDMQSKQVSRQELDLWKLENSENFTLKMKVSVLIIIIFV